MQPPCRKKGRFLLHRQRHNNLQEVIGGEGVRAGEPCAGGGGKICTDYGETAALLIPIDRSLLPQ